MSGPSKHISLQVRDQQGTPYTVALAVAEQHETGMLSIQMPTGETAQRFELTHLRKGEDGLRLTCYASGTTATLSLTRDKHPPELHVSASLFFPIFEAVYQIDPSEQERFIEWTKELEIGLLS
jgi:hypothetical protein